MRKTLLTVLASLALCGAGTAALVMSSAIAQPSVHKPMMVAAEGPELAQNGPPGLPPPPGIGPRNRAGFADRLQQLCEDSYARETGRFAYLETRLELTAAQRPAFERWQDAVLNVARRHQSQCGQRPVAQNDQQAPQPDAARPGPAERLAREEDRLKERLTDIQAERPALEAFENSLSPQQKMTFARSEGGGGMRRPAFAQNTRMGMGRGPMGRPPQAPPER